MTLEPTCMYVKNMPNQTTDIYFISIYLILRLPLNYHIPPFTILTVTIHPMMHHIYHNLKPPPDCPYISIITSPTATIKQTHSFPHVTWELPEMLHPLTYHICHWTMILLKHLSLSHLLLLVIYLYIWLPHEIRCYNQGKNYNIRGLFTGRGFHFTSLNETCHKFHAIIRNWYRHPSKTSMTQDFQEGEI